MLGILICWFPYLTIGAVLTISIWSCTVKLLKLGNVQYHYHEKMWNLRWDISKAWSVLLVWTAFEEVCRSYILRWNPTPVEPKKRRNILNSFIVDNYITITAHRSLISELYYFLLLLYMIWSIDSAETLQQTAPLHQRCGALPLMRT